MTSQISLFGGEEPLKITKKIRLIELFAGIGAQAKALENIGADFEHYRICEFDKYAVAAYNAIHGTDFEVSDITKWHASDLGIEQKDKYEYIMSYSFPCQSLSISGKQEGMAKGSGTRSGLLWEVERILEECDSNLPQVLLMENVDAILFEKNRKHFFQWCNRLEEFGYKNYYQVLNAKDYGIPQNRNRCFMVSILGDYYFEFPKPIKLELCVKDMLEKEVPEKYYISAERVKELLNKEYDGKKGILPNSAKIMTTYPLSTREHRTLGWTENVSALTARDYKDPKVVCIPCLTPDRIEKRQNGRRFKENGEPMFTLTAQDIHGVAIKENNSKGYAIAQDGDTINLEQPNSKTRRGRVGKQIAQTIFTSTEQVVVEEIIPCELRKDEGIRTFNDGCMGALRTSSDCGDKHLICYNYKKPDGSHTSVNDRVYDSNHISAAVTTNPFFMPNYLVREKPEYEYRIRKLMPIECYRLMGFTREDFFKVKEAGISDSQCYKQAGNSIVVQVLEAIFRNMNIKGVKRWQE